MKKKYRVGQNKREPCFAPATFEALSRPKMLGLADMNNELLFTVQAYD